MHVPIDSQIHLKEPEHIFRQTSILRKAHPGNLVRYPEGLSNQNVESGRAYRSTAPLDWNALPIELRTILCINDFKKYL